MWAIKTPEGKILNKTMDSEERWSWVLFYKSNRALEGPVLPWELPELYLSTMKAQGYRAVELVEKEKPAEPEWSIEYEELDASYRDFWNVTDGQNSFRCDSKEQAEWLLGKVKG